jgi:hypothetical protein
MDAAVPMGSARLKDATGRKPHPSRRQGSLHRHRNPFNARKHRVSFDSYPPSITLTKQFHCDLQAPPCKSQPPAIRDAEMRLPAAIAALLHISTLFTSPLFSHPYSIHISIHVTSLLSSHLYSLQIPSHLYSPHIPSRPYFLHISTPTLLTSLLLSHPYYLRIPALFTSLFSFSSHPYSFFSSHPYALHFSSSPDFSV